MCGIAGIIKFGGSTDVVSAIQKMNSTIRHRGPDGEGYLILKDGQEIPAFGIDTPMQIVESSILHKPISSLDKIASPDAIFAHRRLSIIDIQPTGHQPMCNIDKSLWITHNGEIYNYVELKQELIKLGHKFHTSSDTEVILNAYKEWGSDCVKRFNGMWAFVIYDKARNQLFASRDRFGVKPFYYVQNSSVFAFASEQKALLSSSLVQFKPNNEAIFDYWLFSSTEREEEGMFSGILELFPSHSLSLDLQTGELKKWKYYTLNFSAEYDNPQFDNDATVEKVKALVTDSVRLRMRADVEVGSCLSGGIDSSTIVSLMSKTGHKNISTFTASFIDKGIDETKWAKIVSDSVHSNAHLVQPTSKELVKDLHDLIYCQDIPIWSTSTYAQYRVMELIKKSNIKVVLDGQGGDELFAGYEKYYFNYLQDILRSNGLPAFLKASNKIKKQSSVKLYFKQLILKQYLFGLPHKQHMQARLSIHPELKYLNKDFLYSHSHLIEKESDTAESLNEGLYKDFYNALLKSYLKCEDRCSMWHSVESRTPFSDDVNLIEYVFSIPSKYKIKDDTLKPLLREAMRGIVPQQILDRKDKKGYATPNGAWIADIKDDVRHIFENPLVAEYMDTRKILKDYDKLFNRPEMVDNGRIFKLIAFPMWLTIFSKI
ncbi:MAG TPA: asparagine synthase (glutamine-hydrolyzing) [Bacteroidia bacterium]|jgi:asparagine synthase (glutamine-hydrolysing)|nr:asparagine synthase (glutamine-hydrolyzing) [Bacteroidia bacterium]